MKQLAWYIADRHTHETATMTHVHACMSRSAPQHLHTANNCSYNISGAHYTFKWFVQCSLHFEKRITIILANPTLINGIILQISFTS